VIVTATASPASLTSSEGDPSTGDNMTFLFSITIPNYSAPLPAHSRALPILDACPALPCPQQPPALPVPLSPLTTTYDYASADTATRLYAYLHMTYT
jgi:hypothetical protein